MKLAARVLFVSLERVSICVSINQNYKVNSNKKLCLLRISLSKENFSIGLLYILFSVIGNTVKFK